MLICRIRSPRTLGLSSDKASNTDFIRPASTPAHPQISSKDSETTHLDTELEVRASEEQ